MYYINTDKCHVLVCLRVTLTLLTRTHAHKHVASLRVELRTHFQISRPVMWRKTKCALKRQTQGGKKKRWGSDAMFQWLTDV